MDLALCSFGRCQFANRTPTADFAAYSPYAICATVESHYIKYGHTLHGYRLSIFPIAAHSPGTHFSRFFILFIQVVAFDLAKDKWQEIGAIANESQPLSKIPP